MKKIFMMMSALLTAVVLSVGLTACGDDGDDDGGGSGGINVKALVGSSWYKSETYAGGENVETKKYSLSFKTEYFATVQISGYGDDDDGHYRWDYGEKDCPFTISGNVMTIEYKGNNDFQETLKVTFKNNKPVGWTGGGGNADASDVDDTPTTAGTAAMFGYYFPEAFRKSAQSYLDMGYVDNLDETHIKGWHVVDGSQIEWVEMGMAGKDPSKMYNCTVIGKDTKGRATVYYFAFLYAQEEYRYVMKGSTIQLSNGQSLEYKNGQIVESNSVYIKMK